jgi:RNA polymerase sigma-70 factor (ECF subfamily)
LRPFSRHITVKTGRQPAEGHLRELPEETLVRRAAAGDAAAFGNLADRWWQPLYRFGYRLSGNREDAEDICQESLVRAFRSVAELEDHRKFPGWLHRIALRVYQDRRRRERARPTVSLEAVGDQDDSVGLLDRLVAQGSEAGGPARDLEIWDTRRMLQEALDELPDEQREAIVMREFQGLSTSEIAQIVGVPTATIRTRIFYGLKKLHGRLAGPLGETR